MRILMIGTGSVGSAVAAIAARRSFFEAFVAADHSIDRAKHAVAAVSDDRFTATTVDASSAADVAQLCRAHDITHVLNAVDPRFTMPVFDSALTAGADYLDMAMSLSTPHPDSRTVAPGSSSAITSSPQRRPGRRRDGWPWSG